MLAVNIVLDAVFMVAHVPLTIHVHVYYSTIIIKLVNVCYF